MNKTEAVSKLQHKLKELQIQNFNPIVWTNTTNILLKKLFKFSYPDKIKSLNEIEYDLNVPYTDDDQDINKLNDGKEMATQYLNAFIDEINDFGIEKEDEDKTQLQKTSLRFLKNASFWTVIISIIGAAFYLGIMLSGYKFDKEKIELSNNNTQLLKEIDNKNEQLIILRFRYDSLKNIITSQSLSLKENNKSLKTKNNTVPANASDELFGH